MQKLLGKELQTKIRSYSAKKKQEWIMDLLDHLRNVESTHEIYREILSDPRYLGLQDFTPDTRKYPRLRFKLSLSDFNSLQEQAFDPSSMQLDPCLASGKTKTGVPLTPLEKLLYAFLWKQSELSNFSLFLKGLTNRPLGSRDRVVLFEFAKYLTGENNYILDQHTLRCFAVASASDQESIEKAFRIEAITHHTLASCICDYRKFFDDLKSHPGQDGRDGDFFYEVDRVLFAAGKLCKEKRTVSLTYKF